MVIKGQVFSIDLCGKTISTPAHNWKVDNTTIEHTWKVPSNRYISSILIMEWTKITHFWNASFITTAWVVSIQIKQARVTVHHVSREHKKHRLYMHYSNNGHQSILNLLGRHWSKQDCMQAICLLLEGCDKWLAGVDCFFISTVVSNIYWLIHARAC